MKTHHALHPLTLLLLALFAVPVVAGAASQSDDAVVVLEEVVIRIDGMTCSACANGVAASLRRVEGVVEAEVTMEPPEARIAFDPDVISAESLVESIEDLGYEAAVVE